MVVVVEGYNAKRYSDLLEQMFRLRARIFYDRLKWDVQVVEGRERDKFDDCGPVYVIYVDDKTGLVKGSLRLLPTTGSTVLSEVFADTLPAGSLLCSPVIWECSRFCTDERGDEDDWGRDFVALALIVAIGEIGLRTGIQSILGNFDAAMLRLYRALDCEVEILGSTTRYGGMVFLGSFPVSEAIVSRLKARLRRSTFAKPFLHNVNHSVRNLDSVVRLP
jgi:acyl homoserine lactone synthase